MRLIAPLWAGAASLAAPGLRLMLRRRAARGKEIAARLPEREGIDPTPRPPGRLLWLHAASVGESQSILPVIAELVRDPGLTILLTTGTVTSARLLANHLPSFGENRVLHRFVPLDVPAWAARFLDHWQPDAAAFVESELWPNLLAACSTRHIPAMLVNARMSARSLRAWQRAPGFAHHVLGSFARIHPQSAADADRLRRLGATAIDPPGNLKLAAAPLAADPAALAELHGIIGPRPVWLAASTHPGEEAAAAAIHHALAPAHPGLLTIIAPRHPERGAALATALAAPRRAAGDPPPLGGIWIADTMGELGLLYRLAPIVFVGRSLVDQGARGGQNPLEPARLGCAIATGPHTANFADTVERLSKAGALTIVPDQAALMAWVAAMLADPAARNTAAQAAIAAAIAAANGDAALPARVAAALRAMLSP